MTPKQQLERFYLPYVHCGDDPKEIMDMLIMDLKYQHPTHEMPTSACMDKDCGNESVGGHLCSECLQCLISWITGSSGAGHEYACALSELNFRREQIYSKLPTTLPQ